MKKKIESQEDIKTDWQVLQFGEAEDLEESKKLYEYNIVDGSIIHLILTAMTIVIQKDNENISLQVILYK